MTAHIEVGDTLPPLSIEPITRTTLALFAGGSGDHNPVHVDLDAARQSGMDDVFAHGMLSLAYVGRLLTGWVPQQRIRGMHVRFAAITPVHAQPTCTATVTAIDESRGGRIATLEVAVTLADGTTTLSGTATVDID